MIGFVAILAVATSQPTEVRHTTVTDFHTSNEKCICNIKDDDGPLTIVVSWSDCEHLQIAPMTTSALEAADQLTGLAKAYAKFVDERRLGEVISVWSEYTAAFYFRSAGQFFREVFIAD